VWEEELAFANQVADEADAIALGLFRSASLEVRQKDDLTPVTEADTRIEAMVRERVSARFPDDAILGEEEGLVGEADNRRTWILDPIDGTKNFAGGIQIWATLLALRIQEPTALGLMTGPVVGVVSAPALGERYEAARGQGARLNGEPIRVSDVADLSDALVVSSGLKDWMLGPLAEPFRAIVSTVRRARAFGDFWGHMLVARGAAEAMLEPSLRTWDTAAVQVVVEEAGGRMSSLDGSPLRDHGSALSTNGRLHDELAGRFARLG
jgi:histidinol-phosphatase